MCYKTGQFYLLLTGFKVACPEEVAYHNGWITAEQLEMLAQSLIKNGYGKYLLKIIKEQCFV